MLRGKGASREWKAASPFAEKKGLMAQGAGGDQGKRDNGSAEARKCGGKLPPASVVE